MHLLPIHAPDDYRFTLPLSDPSAERLLPIWLEMESARRLADAARWMRDDPALVWWAFLHVGNGRSAKSSGNGCSPLGSGPICDVASRDQATCGDEMPERDPLERPTAPSVETWIAGLPTWRELARFIAHDCWSILSRTSSDGHGTREPAGDFSRDKRALFGELSARARWTGERAAQLPGAGQMGEFPGGWPRVNQREDPSSFSLARQTTADRVDPDRVDPDRDVRFLLGILSWSDEWFAASEIPPECWSEILPPAILAEIRRLPGIAQARGETPSIEPIRRDSQVFAANVDSTAHSCLQDAWGATTSQIHGWLGDLAGRLWRWEMLETRFERELRDAKLRALKEFAYGASHEINNPLANISTRAQTLLRDEHDPDRCRQLATINSQAFRAHEMISNVMLFAHPPRLVLREFDLIPLLQQVHQELANQAEAQETRFELHLDCDAARLDGDENQIAVAIKNVIQNSLEAVAQGGRITLHLTAGPEDHYTLRIRDDGPGVPRELRPHLFDPFFSGREAGRGLGLGLSKAWSILAMHGATIELEAEPQDAPEVGLKAERPADKPEADGSGTVFLIHLPPTGTRRDTHIDGAPIDDH